MGIASGSAFECREMWAFANNDDIRRAIHAKPISKIGRFDECSDRITYTHDTASMIPIHADLISKGSPCCQRSLPSMVPVLCADTASVAYAESCCQ